MDEELVDVEELNEPLNEVEELEDGSAVVTLGDETADLRETPDFIANLADGYLEDHDLKNLATKFCELIESDKASRAKRDEQYAEGIKRTGLGNDAPGGAGFDGASRTVHPMLAKGCVDFTSRVIKEIFPPTGPCKTQIVGESDDAKVDKAERKKTYMNWQLTTRVSENRTELERLLGQLPLGGSQYKRWWFDKQLKRPRTETVYVDDVFIPYSQSDFYSSCRVTHRQWVSADVYAARVESGFYRDLGLSSPITTDQSKSKLATDKVEGAEEDSAAYNEEGMREVYQCYTTWDVEGDGERPYVLHIDAYTENILAVYRNWAEKDETYTKKHWMVEYNFIPWRGPYGIGLLHLIGSLAASGTGAIRALLDAGFIQTFPGGLKLKAGRTSGQSIQVNATELAEVEAPPGVDDIRKLVMPFPFAGPSPVLFNLLEWLTTQAESVIATASEKIADAGANMPVGTALALIEHGSANFSAIHARCHASMKQELAILHRLDAENITDRETVKELGELVVTREDFQGPMDIVPVSDPNIFSEAQRYAQYQAVMQLAADPTLAPYFKRDRLLKRGLRLLQISDADDITNLPKDPKRMTALQENYTVASPEPWPLKVYEEQDDVAHLESHLHFLVSPMFGANPLIGPMVVGPMSIHLRDHMMFFYRKHATAASDAVKMVAHLMGQEVTQDEADAKGSAFADTIMANLLGPMVMPALQKAGALAMQFAPKPPVDPAITAKIASDKELKGMELAAREKELSLTLPENEKERQNKLAIESAKLQAGHTSQTLQIEQNDRSAAMAATLQTQQQELSKNLAAFEAKAQADRAAQDAQARAAQERQKAENEVRFALLQAALDKFKAPPTSVEETVEPGADVAAVIAPIIETVQLNASAMMEQLVRSLAEMQAANAAPRVARYIKDAAGNNVGVESVSVQPPV